MHHAPYLEWRLAARRACLFAAVASCSVGVRAVNAVPYQPGPGPGQAQRSGPLPLDASQRAQAQALRKLRAEAALADGHLPSSKRARDASWVLGLLVLHGIGMPADGAQAQDWFERAHRMGHPLAPAGLAWCAIDACTGLPQFEAARTWIGALAQVDPARALYLEWVLAKRQADATGPGSSQVRDATSMRELLLRAERLGSPQALAELAIEDAAAGRQSDALRRFRQAAQHSPSAAANAARLSERPLPAQALAGPSAQEWFLQALRYHRGEGVPSNYAEAVRLYEMAAARGHGPARRMLELIFSRQAPGGGVDVQWMQQLARADVSSPGPATIQPTPGPPLLLREPSPLYDLVPAEWRRPPAAR